MKTTFKTTVAILLALWMGGLTVQAADLVISNGESIKYSETTGFTLTTNIVGPTGSDEKGTFYMDVTDTTFENRYKGTISGNLDIYKTGSQNWRMNNANSDFNGNFYHQGGNVYLATGHELGNATIYWKSGQIVNEGNDGIRDSVINNNIVLENGGDHVTRCGWNTTGGTGAKAYLTFNGVISGNGNMGFGYWEGTPGTITINGANTYSGTTALRGTPWSTSAITPYGAFVLGNNQALSTGKVFLQGATQVDLSQITALENSMEINSYTESNTTFKESTLLNSGTGTVTLGKTGSTLEVKSGVTGIIKNTGAGSINLSHQTVTNGGTLKLQNTGAGTITVTKVALTGTMTLENTGTGAVRVGTPDEYSSSTGGTFKFESSGTVYVTNGFSSSITGPSADGKKVTVYFKEKDLGSYTGKLSGNMDVVIQAGTRFINNATDFTGSITSSANTYFRYGNEMGGKKTNVITFNGGQIVNQDQSNPVIPNDVVLNNTITVRAGWNSTGYGGGDQSSVTLTGDISGNGGINFNGENNPGAVYLRGNNTYKGNSKVEYGYVAESSAKGRSWFGLGTDTPFGTGSLTLNSNMPTTVLCLETTGGVQRNLATPITVSKNTLEFQNNSTGDAFITSSIKVDSGKDIQFGSTYSPDENGTGKIYFDGTITQGNAVVNACTTLGGSGTMKNVVVSNEAALYLSSAKNYGNDLEINDLTLNGDLQIDLDPEIGVEQPLMSLSSLTLGDDTTLIVNLSGDPSGTTTLFAVANGVDLAEIARHLSVTGAGAGYALNFADGLLTITGNVPEPSAWLLLLLGLPLIWRRKRG
ncbi:MAG: PEP-CTERM sorting domain-containing protein [Thermoguttaceae bacterium]|nr:PEP-CTERM sorting domain-containing protein [Thermoguttaceae bacterium]